MTSNIILGTAQLVENYGITNSQVVRNPTDAGDLLSMAKNVGVTTLDTAESYSGSFNAIADFNSKGGGFKVISKWKLKDVETRMSELVDSTIKKLGVSQLEGFLSHQPSDMFSSNFPKVFLEKRALKGAGLIKKLGFSIYTESELRAALKLVDEIDVLQIPGSIVNADLMRSSLVQELRQSGTEIHVRSIFLQGLLLAPSSNNLSRESQLLLEKIRREIIKESAELDLKPEKFLCECVLQSGLSDQIILGFVSVDQLQSVSHADSVPKIDTERIFSVFKSLSADFDTDPRNW